MDISELKDVIRKFALENALKFGKASPGAVIGKVVADLPEVKKFMKTLSFEINELLPEINEMPQEKIKEEIEQKYPELLNRREKEERNLFSVLNIREDEKVKTAFPPGPEKYPHIGHAKACLLNYELAKKHNGQFILRFEDTNPNLVKAVFYDMLIDNLSWLGIKWDELIYASDNMELFYEYAAKAIGDGNAYMCFCNEEAIKRSGSSAVECMHRNHSAEENMKFWKEMPGYEESTAILRLKIDLNHQNSTMRDPTIFRVIKTPHARHDTKYSVWPNYDWQNAIMDGYYGITHRLRSKEFEMRSELQRYVQKMLGLHVTQTYEFARFNLKGVESSGRVIREKVNLGEYIGWDDPRLTTLVALRRRGFLPEAIRNFVISTGITKSESTLTWDDLIIQNRRILDRTAKRYFMMHDYEKVTIHNSPHQQISMHLHPSNDEYGERKIESQDEFLLSREDISHLKENERYRLMDCLNFRKAGGILEFDSIEYDNYKQEGARIMHWLPAYGNIDIEILMDDATRISGFAEHNIKELKIGEVIQFERFGFCRLDSIEKKNGKEKYGFWFTHR